MLGSSRVVVHTSVPGVGRSDAPTSRDHVRTTKVKWVTESIADGLSVVGLVVGFPLLLLGLMLSLEKLESWGLRSTDPDRPDAPELPDPIGDAVEQVEQLTAVDAEAEQTQATFGSAHRLTGRSATPLPPVRRTLKK